MSLPHARRLLKPLLFTLVAVLVFSELPTDLVRRRDAPAAFPYLAPTPLPPTPKPYAPPPQHVQAPLGKHRYRADGLVETNFEGAHPIYELIARAELEWDAKLLRASRSLEDAVAEYRRRYARKPPKGFDRWWKYVVDNDVQLPDEYDQIFNDLEPFWGLEPADLIDIQRESELQRDSYTIGKKTDRSDIEVLAYAFEEGKYNQLIAGSVKIVEMLQKIQDDLPAFRMTLSPHDGPNRLTDHGIKEALLQAAEGQTYMDRASLPKVHKLGWVSACPPDSPARVRKIDLDNPPPRPTKKTFIYDHLRTMDPCNHPDLFHHHGQFLTYNYGPAPRSDFVPAFAYCSTTIHHNIRFPVPYIWVEDIYPRSDDPEFDDKHDERLLWRGSNTGIFHTPNARWKQSHRDFLVGYANDFDGTVPVLQPNVSRTERVGAPRELRKARVNPAVMDIAFGGNAILCHPPVCQMVEEAYPFRERQTLKEAGSYKYVLDVDGNGWSGRFKRLITSNSLIFKSTIYPEWYADRIAPWVHYIPIQVDYSDLHDAIFFFRGDGNGDGAHEHLARKIALAGRTWSKTFWRQEDMIAYFFRLMLEYSRLMSLDRDAMTFELD